MSARRNKPQIRRQGDTETCQRIWDVINQIKNDRKAPTAENIIRISCKTYDLTPEFLEEQLKFLLEDGLLVQKTTIPIKGCTKGVQHEIVCIPVESGIKLDTSHDWYCFNCHKPGEVLACSKCPRVYHLKCLDPAVEEKDWNSFVCLHCKEISTSSMSDDEFEMRRADINRLFGYACTRLQEKLPIDTEMWNPVLSTTAFSAPNTTERCAALLSKLQKQVRRNATENEAWRANYLLKISINLTRMDSKTDRQVYKSIEHFRLDALTLVHNVCIFHGEHSPIADSTRVMYRDCQYELEEIKVCEDCYRRSNEQENEDWFCLPCDPPHELVFAKARSYPFWPAKVLKVANDTYDVRFFGSGHDRATLGKAFIRPINTPNIHNLVTKRKVAWGKAMEELSKHQEMLAEAATHDSDEEEDENNIESSNSNVQEEPVEPPESSGDQHSVCTKKLTVSVCRIDERTRSGPPLAKVRKVINFDSNELSLDVSDAFDNIPDLPPGDVDMLLAGPSQGYNVPFDPIAEKVDLLEANAKIDALKQENAILQEAHRVEIGAVREELQASFSREMDAIKRKHAAEIEILKEEYEKQILINKKRQWCVNCSIEAKYLCCASVSYCSTECQKNDWNMGHKKVCKRDRGEKSNKQQPSQQLENGTNK